MLGVKILDADDADVQRQKRKEDKGRKSKKKDRKDKKKDGDAKTRAAHTSREGDTAGRDMWDRMFAEPADVKIDEALPEPEEVETKAVPKPTGNDVDSAGKRTGSFTVGDGGASWRMKALKRAQNQADEQGASLRDVVSQRWGSVSELAQGADKAAPMDAHRQFNRGMQSKMMRPGGGGGDEWRKRGEGRREGDGQRRGTSGKRQRQDYGDVMARAAKEMNAFKGDGSFMEQFETRGESDATGERGVERPRPFQSNNDNDDRRRLDGDQVRPAPRSVPVPSAPQPSTTPTHSPQPTPKDNNSVAAMLRARLAGKALPISSAPSGPSDPSDPSGPAPNRTAVHLPMVDAHGRAAPGAFGRETAVQSHAKPADRADLDLQTMVRRVKHGTEEDMNVVIARNIAKNTHYRDTAADDEYDFDVGQDILTAQKVSKRGKKDPNAELERREKARQIHEYRRMTKTQNQCRMCLDKNNANANAHLTVSISPTAYLALPDRGRLVPGHCCVVPTDHIASTRLADESTWEEMRNFKKCVLQMMQSKGMDCIFFETALDVTSTIPKHHARIDCVPVSPQVMDRAPMYFKKAIEDATSDWSQHASKGCIETESRHLQRKIPPNFPYVHIEFGLASGYVSVIDDVSAFDPKFCRRVILGLLESSGTSAERRLCAGALQAKGTREGTEVQKTWVEEFKQAYKEFDWMS